MLRRHFIINTNSGIPYNEIWYTSSDDNIITPYGTALPPIVSNTYVDGKGVIKFERNVKAIDNSAFWSRKTLTSITIPNSVEIIQQYAFSYCSSLTYIISNNVNVIGHMAFAYCSSLTYIIISNSVYSIGTEVFIGCSSLKSINVDSNNPNYSSVDGVLFNKDKATLVAYPGGKQGVYTIPNSVTSIGFKAFNDCSSLTSVTIPNSVKSIGYAAFGNCTSLTSVTIPNSVERIDTGAFQDCSSLTSVTIGNSVTSIGFAAFHNCTSLNSITFEGTIEQWEAITKETDWNLNVPATIVHCTDGDVEI